MQAVTPIHLARADGSCFWDGDGKRYIDMNSQLMCSNIGHNHPKVNLSTSFTTTSITTTTTSITITITTTTTTSISSTTTTITNTTATETITTC
jgi:4-aminobutyrate aminotransferase-like enzyme